MGDIRTGDADVDRLLKIAHRAEQEGKKPTAEMIYNAASEIARLKQQFSWQPIETAPRDGSPVLMAALGIENTGWMRGVVRWGCRAHCLSSRWHDCSETKPECNMTWLGTLGHAYGVPITHWMPLPEPPQSNGIPADSAGNVSIQEEK